MRRIVANVAVVSELERLESRATRDAESLRQASDQAEALASQAEGHAREQRRAEALLATRRRRFDDRIAQGKTDGKVFARVALEHQQALCAVVTLTARGCIPRRC